MVETATQTEASSRSILTEEAHFQNTRYEEFSKFIVQHPGTPRKDLAQRFGVTRQTIQVWLRAYRRNEHVRRRGRPYKFGAVPSQTFTIRLPVDLIGRIEQGHSRSSRKAITKVVRQVIDRALLDTLAGHGPVSLQSRLRNAALDELGSTPDSRPGLRG